MDAPHQIGCVEREGVADGVRENLRREHGGQSFDVDVWKDGFFSEAPTLLLNTFLNRPLCYDVAVLGSPNRLLCRPDAERGA